jgi:hypothetical protein
MEVDFHTCYIPILKALILILILSVEGTLTCVISFAFFFLLPDFPENSKWLNKEETAYVVARLEADQGKSASERKITLRDVARVFKDPKILVGGFMYFGVILKILTRLTYSSNYQYRIDSSRLRLCLFLSRHHPIVRLLPDSNPIA